MATIVTFSISNHNLKKPLLHLGLCDVRSSRELPSSVGIPLQAAVLSRPLALWSVDRMNIFDFKSKKLAPLFPGEYHSQQRKLG